MSAMAESPKYAALPEETNFLHSRVSVIERRNRSECTLPDALDKARLCVSTVLGLMDAHTQTPNAQAFSNSNGTEKRVG